MQVAKEVHDRQFEEQASQDRPPVVSKYAGSQSTQTVEEEQVMQSGTRQIPQLLLELMR